jgi:hypothetical protein
MPYYSFDLAIDEEIRYQGGLILEDLKLASDRADQLANERSIVRPELKARDCAICITDQENRELLRRPLDPIPAWTRAHRRY